MMKVNENSQEMKKKVKEVVENSRVLVVEINQKENTINNKNRNLIRRLLKMKYKNIYP